MRVYVAGKTHCWRQVRDLQQRLEGMGHEITFDWTQSVEVAGLDDGLVDTKARKQAAEDDLEGVQTSDLVVCIVDTPNLSGTLVEFGLALAWGKDLHIIGQPYRNSVFYELLPLTHKHPDRITFLEYMARSYGVA